MKTFKNYLEIIQEANSELPDGLEIINATPHDIVTNGITYPTTGNPARVSTKYKSTDNDLFIFDRRTRRNNWFRTTKKRNSLYSFINSFLCF